MAQYPIKLLKDESGQPFVPLTQINAVVGNKYITTTFEAEQISTGHFVITNDKITDEDLSAKVIAVMFPETVTATTNSYLKLNDGNEYLIYDEDGKGPLLIKDFANVVCFLMRKPNSWQLVKTGAAAASSSGGHAILDNDGNVMPQQSILQFKGFGVNDNPGTGATVISTPALINNLSTTESGSGPLDAYQGKVLNDKFANYALQSSLSDYAPKSSLNNYLLLSGGTMTGALKILGTAASQPLTVRGIVGCTAEGEVSELHLQYQANAPIKLGNDAGYSISADGGQYSGNAATATSAAKATKDGDGNTISSTYLKLSGGTMTGSIKRAGDSYSWNTIRESNESAPIAITSYSGYQPAIKQKTPSGVWGIGCYTNNVHITYFADGTTHNDPTYLLNMSYDGKGISSGGVNLPHVWVQSSQPSAKQTGDIWFVT